MCKMARGKMVRFMVVNQIKKPEAIQVFEGLDYRYSPEYSDEHTCVFVRRKAKKLQECEYDERENTNEPTESNLSHDDVD